MITNASNKRLRAAWSAVCEVKGFDPKNRDLWLHALSIAVDHEVKSSTELDDKREVPLVMEYLEGLQKEGQPKLLSPAQWGLWQREWGKVVESGELGVDGDGPQPVAKLGPVPSVFEERFLRAALAGCPDGPCTRCALRLQSEVPISRDEINNHQFSNLLGEFAKITKPGDIQYQMRQERMTRTNQIRKIEDELVPMLAELLEGAPAARYARQANAKRFIAAIIEDKFTWGKWLRAKHPELGAVRMKDVVRKGQVIEEGAPKWLVAEFREACPRPQEFDWRVLADHEITELLKTVWARIEAKRRAAKLTAGELRARAFPKVEEDGSKVQESKVQGQGGEGETKGDDVPF
jgi:hypothetical protein